MTTRFAFFGVGFLLFASFLLFGCVDSPTAFLPFTTSQLINQSTDLNYTLFKQGVYDNMVLVVDGNKLSVADQNDLNINVINDPSPFFNYVDLNTVYGASSYEGRLKWNNVDGTLDVGLKGGNVVLQVGEELVERVVNKTGANLLESDYSVVRIRKVSEGGAQGQRLAVLLAQGDSENNSTDVLGVVTENIVKNEEGFVTTYGTVNLINTTGALQGESWSDGDLLYLSPSVPGGLTNVVPDAPNHLVIVGYVSYAHATHGKIFVSLNPGWELEELHNVDGVDPDANGDLLSYNASLGVWERNTYNIRDYLLRTDANSLFAFKSDVNYSGYVPYKGATSDVNLGAKNLIAKDINADGNFYGRKITLFGNGSNTALDINTYIGATAIIKLYNQNPGTNNSIIDFDSPNNGTNFYRFYRAGNYIGAQGNGSTAMSYDTNSNYYWYKMSGSTPYSTLLARLTAGGLGIGVPGGDSGGGLVHINGTTPYFHITDATTTTTATSGARIGLDSAHNLEISQQSAYGMTFDTNNAERIRILTGGNVGIKTTNPTEVLEVNGNLALTSDNQYFYLGTAKDASVYYDGTNLVANPKVVGTGIFNILGDINTTGIRMPIVRIGNSQTAQNSTYQTSTYVGIYAGRYNNGGGNSFFGYNAGAGLVGGTNTGSNNFGMGYNSLAKISLGENNIGIGTGSLQDLNDSPNNIAIGTNAGKYLTSEANNTLIGVLSGSNMKGSQNVCVGNSTGTVTAGSYNTFIGYEAGKNARGSTGYNVFLGNKVGSTSPANNTLMIDNSDTNTPLIWGDFTNDIVVINQDFNVIDDSNIGGDLYVSNNTTIDGNVSYKNPHATFLSLKTQTIASTGVGYLMDFNTTVDAYQISRVGDNNFKFARAGEYEIILRIIAQSSTSDKRVNIWFAKNGSTIANSNTLYDFKSASANSVISVPFIIDVNANDTVSVMYSANDTGVTLPYIEASSPAPATPSAIATIKWISALH